MQLITINDIFNFSLIAIFLLLWLPPAWLLMRFLTPKKLVEHYFRVPHFTSAEITLFSHFPGSLMRTMIFIAGCVHPHRGEKRQMIGIRNHVPYWYIVASKFFFWSLVIHVALAFLPFIGVIIYMELFKT